MKTTLIIFSLIILTTHYSLLNSTLWEIKQDGGGDFTTITAGINAARHGDTLLVYPGRYLENINYSGKNITVTSLYGIESDDRRYIRETIIDGNKQGSVVVFNSGETRNAVLNGFTITNGTGNFYYGTSYTMGGGIFMRDSSPIISHCIIEHNMSGSGSGIRLIRSGNPLLKGNTVRYNHALRSGAVVSNWDETNLEFCTEYLNNIYLNYGAMHADLIVGGPRQSSIIVDTLTVLNHDKYYVRVAENVSLTVKHGKIEPVAADLYVSPDGSDNNSGLTPEEPLQTIAHAMTKIAPDSLHQRTVYLAEGVYSRSLNNQRFPIQLRSYIDIVGVDQETTVLDLEGETLALYSYGNPQQHQFSFIKNFTVKNLTIVNGGNPWGSRGRGAISLSYNSSFTLKNINIINCRTGGGEHNLNGTEVVFIYYCRDVVLKNLNIYDNSGHQALRMGNYANIPLNLYAENIRIRKQAPGPLTPGFMGGEGGGIHIIGNNTAPPNITFVNLEITNCTIDNIDPFWGRTADSMLQVFGVGGNIRIINSTIGDNNSAAQDGGGVLFSRNNTYELYNTIIYGNSPYQLSLHNDFPERGYVTISHSLLQGGREGVDYVGNPNIEVNWGEGNIDTNPMWVGEEVNPFYPYMLSENSPARGAGTLDIPNFEFPEYDLAGNPRIVDGKIDMGAYQWHPPTSVDDDVGTGYHTVRPDYNLRNFPNPVTSLSSVGANSIRPNERSSTGTNIAFDLPEAGNVMIEIYNLKGQFVKRIFDAYIPKGEHNVFWDGRDERGRYVATGFYMYNLHINDRLAATGRATFIK